MVRALEHHDAFALVARAGCCGVLIGIARDCQQRNTAGHQTRLRQCDGGFGRRAGGCAGRDGGCRQRE